MTKSSIAHPLPASHPDSPLHSDESGASCDRNFDAISEHFVKKVYSGMKGRIRLAVLGRDLDTAVAELSAKLGRPLRILDVGAGLAQLSLNLASEHEVTVNDISVNMLELAKQQAQDKGMDVRHVTFIACPYQDLHQHLGGAKFDLIFCHALLEWLANPSEIMPFFNDYLSDDGILSLCFYNPASLIYRNLVMGNFYQLDAPRPADNKSLTPNHPVPPEDVDAWLDSHGYHILTRAGVRVFSDYAPLKRGGLNNPDDVVAMELRYSQQMPFCLMGRYLHILAKKDGQPNQCGDKGSNT